MARAFAEARQRDLLEQASTAAARLAAADRAYKEGDIRVASGIYVRMALRRATDPATAEAKQRAQQRLAELAEEARQKLKEIDATLEEEGTFLSPGELFGAQGELPAQWVDRVTEAFQQYDRLADDYGGVPEAKGQIRAHIAKQRRRPEFAATLNEPEAKALWELAQQHEAEDHQCCAYWVYRQAARLTPAPSARRASDRLAEMEQDPQIVAAAETCRRLQQCHKIYNRAERLIELRPQRAKELFQEIIALAPEDSEVYRAARMRMQQMG